MLGVDRTEGTLSGRCALSGRCSVAKGSGDSADSCGGLRYSGAGSTCSAQKWQCLRKHLQSNGFLEHYRQQR